MAGGIAAYKAIEVCRRLVDAGAYVSPVMTPGATRFVGALTFSALASEPVRMSLWDSPEPIPHTRLGQRADLIVVAPATARLIAAYAIGLSSDLLVATLLATRAPVMICPAMHTEMWEHPAVQENLATLRRRGVLVVEPGAGRLAGGDVGRGRLAEPEEIVAAAAAVLAGPGVADAGETAGPGELAGVRALVTAGGTREPIDPVRFVGNRSSGKQGHAIAAELAARGAKVTLVTTVSLPVEDTIEVVEVETAAEMEAAVLPRGAESELVVMAAAVADFRPQTTAGHKIKKSDGIPVVVLEATIDILAQLGAHRRPGQILVGFAAETVGAEGLRAYAQSKLVAKGVDLVVANNVAAPGVGFGHDTNAVIIVAADGASIDVPLSDKRQVAAAVVDAVVAHRRRHPTTTG